MYESYSVEESLKLQQSVKDLLEELKEGIGGDFTAVALYDPENREIRWRVAFGALNERYRGIAIRMGKGIAGDVMLTKRPMMVASFPEDLDLVNDPLDYPIMITEQLVSCYAAPVVKESGDMVFGVILAAQRSTRTYSSQEQEKIAGTAQKISYLYSPHYHADDLPKPTTLYKKKYSSRSVLSEYFHQQNGTGRIRFEILDQRITQIADRLQREIIGWFDRLSELLNGNKLEEEMHVVIERKSDFWISLELSVNHRLDNPRSLLGWLIERMGELKGNLEMFNEPDRFLLILNLSITTLFESRPWTFE